MIVNLYLKIHYKTILIIHLNYQLQQEIKQIIQMIHNIHNLYHNHIVKYINHCLKYLRFLRK